MIFDQCGKSAERYIFELNIVIKGTVTENEFGRCRLNSS